MSPDWVPVRITTTPNNHTQIWWISENTTTQDLGIWDLNPDGSLNSLSPLITAPNTWLLSASACPFNGADNKLRALWYVGTAPNQSYQLVTYDPTNNWATTSLTLSTTN